MKATFYNPIEGLQEIIDTENLSNDSGEPWTEKLLRFYITSVCPGAKNIEISIAHDPGKRD